MKPHVVLVGAGHGHLYAIRRAAEYAARGVLLTLVAPEPFRYSGMASGVLGGMYPPGANEVEVAACVTGAGGRVVRARAVRIDPGARLLHLDDGEALRYDALSLNVGSEVAVGGGWDSGDGGDGGWHRAGDGRGACRIWPVKPVAGLTALRGVLEARFAQGSGTHVVVMGGGASGCEIAANLCALARRRGGRLAVTLVHDGDRLLETAPPRASAVLAERLARAGVDVRLERRVAAVRAAGVRLDDGSRLAAELVVAATGLRAPALIGTSRLPIASDGALLVDAQLRSVGDPRVLAVGDAAAFEPWPLPKVGVHAVRQAPVLHHNLLASVTGGVLRRFEPQRRYLLILNLGDGTALAMRGGLHWIGRPAMWLKDRIDRRFLRGRRGEKGEKCLR